MLSRVADSLYWLSRYVERVDNLARMVNASRHEELESTASAEMEGSQSWDPLLYATCMDDAYKGSMDGDKDVSWFITYSPENPDSIQQCVAHARENARMVRDQISEELWLELNSFHLYMKSGEASSLLMHQPDAFFRKVIQFSMLVSGLIGATILQDEGWHFIELGKYLERADKTTRILDMIVFQGDPQRSRLSSALLSCSGLSAFRTEYRGQVTLDNVMNFLLFSQSFPRSVRFCVRQLDEQLHTLSGTSMGAYSNEAERLTGSLIAQLNFNRVENVMQTGPHVFVDDLQKQFNDIGQQIFETFVLLPLEIRKESLQENWRWQVQQQQQQ